ncbi:MAG: lipocalin family protein [Methylicorpusculum sp.]|uniref:lipocalin family protein n=1 Tax=Methylicorpusculum sp. TaxID=2713644 RepID=UPI00271B42DA|nr:lipocalin family protein [Methylicorpusculum sp.]MDO8938641.1 lipocalin family protein [Methylicorpusculum sp.]MDO9239776.1 lipocalin family protein [Methylicorpusculum sp.]MDP2179234.1 lipocalin family protein [Methylicorpusculum sp.]MDP2204319.1 lipocalin family protein [Methylicorpusculum sp.]MDP3530015.1 lipocalin family protein [Methylicorpusculum sp.]
MKTLILIMAWMLCSCSSFTSKELPVQTVNAVEIPKFMGKWYVLAGRFTFFEKEVHNGVETYSWNEESQRIDIDFTYNRGSFNGELKSLPQKGWIYNTKTQAHWKVSPFWPLKFDYLIVALAEDYSWTAIGVPDQKYLWIMARDWKNPDSVVAAATRALKDAGYDAQNLVTVPHRW